MVYLSILAPVTISPRFMTYEKSPSREAWLICSLIHSKFIGSVKHVYFEVSEPDEVRGFAPPEMMSHESWLLPSVAKGSEEPHRVSL